MSMIRAVVLSVRNRFHGLDNSGIDPDGNYHYYVEYKILKRGRKRLLYTYVRARDEMEAFTSMRDRLRQKGYKL